MTWSSRSSFSSPEGCAWSGAGAGGCWFCASSWAAAAGLHEFSARWTGFLTPAASGTYQVGLEGSRNRLWFDGKLIVDDPELHDPKPSIATMQLEKGHRYAVKIEYLRGGFGTKFSW